MGRRMQHRTEFGFEAARVIEAFVDAEYLRQRLAKIGGSASELVSHQVVGDTSTAVMRQGIDADDLPSVVRRITPNGVLIERTETWTGLRGAIAATVGGMPGSLRGTLVLADAGPGSALNVDAEIKVGIPLVGGSIESVIAEQLAQLLTAEARFTTRWLENR